MHDSLEIERLRPIKNVLDPDVPYHFLHETEPDINGKLQKTNTIFLTSKECSFKCLMCDLWKNTLNGPTPAGAVVKQIDYALERLPQANVIKLYNSGNFFDLKAVPPSDYPQIAERVQHFERVIVENHPRLCNDTCVAFSNQITGQLEIAMGLETIHPDVLPRLNKQMTADDFKQAAAFLISHNIAVRAFILLNPPYLTDKKENIEWVLNTIRFAFDSGASCCSIIATRSGNGIMDLLQKQSNYVPPTLDTLEEIFDTALGFGKGLVFADTWDIGFLSDCPHCFEARKHRLDKMNAEQKVYQRIACTCQSNHA